MKMWTIVFLVLSVSNSFGGTLYSVNEGGTTSQTCPANLSSLRPQMERTLASVSSPQFKKTMLESLSASIPDAIQQADGLNGQIAFLKSEIAEQYRVQRYSEKIARESMGNFMEPLTPCLLDEKGSYCTTVEQYYISVASNLANRAFLDALICYQKQGMR